MITILLIGMLLIIPMIFFLLTQQAVLKLVQPHNRNMGPGEVFLQLIPVFGLIWQFVVVARISNAIQKELAQDQLFSFEQGTNGTPDPSFRPTYSIGITYCTLFCCSIIPILGLLASFAGLVCWILYWVKLSEYKTKLQQKRIAILASTHLS